MYEIRGNNLKDDFVEMIKLLKRPLVLISAIAAFMYLMTEQGIMGWLPTFNHKILHLPEGGYSGQVGFGWTRKSFYEAFEGISTMIY